MTAFGYDIKNADKLNTTDFGVGFHIPFGVKVFYKNNFFFKPEFRFSQNFLSFGSSDAYLKERDKGTIKSIQGSFGIGFIIN